MKKTFAIISLITILLLWGTSFVVTKNALSGVAPGFLVFCRGLVTVVVLLPFCKGKLSKLNKKQVLFCLAVGLVVGLAYLTQIVGLGYTTPAKCAFLENAYCLILPFLIWAFQKRIPSTKNWICTLLCLTGIVLICFNSLDLSINVGDVLCFIAGILFGVNIALTGVYGGKINAIVYTTLQFCSIAFVGGVYTLLFERQLPNFLDTTVLLPLLYVCVLTSAVAWLLRNFAQQHLSPLTMGACLPFTAVIGTALSIVLQMDSLTPLFVVGALLMTLAIVLDAVLPSKQQVLATANN